MSAERHPTHLVERATQRLLRHPGLAGAQSLLDDEAYAAPAGPPMVELPPDAAPPHRDGNRADAPLPNIETIRESWPAAPASRVPRPRPAAPAVPTRPPISLTALERAGLAAPGRGRVQEEFRVALGEMLRRVQAGRSQCVMVTSARPGEGKSFVALNVAGGIARHAGRRVLLVDADAQRCTLTRQLALERAPGWRTLATPAMRWEDVVMPTALPALSVMPIGEELPETAPHAPPGMLIEQISQRHADAIVLIDAPPCLVSSDPSSLAPLVGQTVLVVEAERTQRNEIETALGLLHACPSVSLLLNKVRGRNYVLS